MSEYDFDISYVKGTMSKVEDALSRRPHIFSMLPLKTNLREKISKLQLNDEWYKEVKLELEIEVMKVPKYEGYALEDHGLLRFKKRIYVPPNDEILNLILFEAHTTVYMAQQGVKKMYAELKPLFFWNEMKSDVVIMWQSVWNASW